MNITEKSFNDTSKYGSIDLEKVKRLAQMGMTDAYMSDFFGVSTSTWNHWKTTKPEFSKILTVNLEEAVAKIELTAYQKAVGWSHNERTYLGVDEKTGKPKYVEQLKIFQPDFNSIKFFLCNRASDRWQDRKANDIDVKYDSKSIAQDIISGRGRAETLIGGVVKEDDTEEEPDFLQ